MHVKQERVDRLNYVNDTLFLAHVCIRNTWRISGNKIHVL